MIFPTNDFDWSADESVVCHKQPATAVYRNQRGDIAIRQEAAWDEDSDALIVIRPENALAIADAIKREAGEALREANPMLALPAPEPKDATAAERMRRYRARKRNGDVTQEATAA